MHYRECEEVVTRLKSFACCHIDSSIKEEEVFIYWVYFNIFSGLGAWGMLWAGESVSRSVRDVCMSTICSTRKCFT